MVKTLLDFSMEKAKALGVGAICIEGNIDFYGKSGFVTASTKDSLLCRIIFGKRIKRGFLLRFLHFAELKIFWKRIKKRDF